MLEFNFVYGSMGYEICKNFREGILGTSATDEKEDESFHFVGYDKLEQIGVARLTKINDLIYEISYVAVKDGYRRQFVGDLIMRALADKAINLGAKEAVLNSPVALIPFFEYEDYKTIGKIYEVDGEKYVKMTKDLTVPQKCKGCKG